MASSSNIFKPTTAAAASTAMNKNATSNKNSNNNNENSRVKSTNISLLDINNKSSNFVVNTTTTNAASATSPIKILHSNDIKLLSDTALLSSIDLFGANSKCDHNTYSGLGSGSGDGVSSSSSSNEKSVLTNSKSLASLIAENVAAIDSSTLPSSNETNHNNLGIVKSPSIGKLKSLNETLKSSNELKRMAGTTQTIEANLSLMSTTPQASSVVLTTDKDFNVNETFSSSSIIRDISMSNIDDMPPRLNLSPTPLGVNSSDGLKCSCKSLFSNDNEDNKYESDNCKSATNMSSGRNEMDSSTNKLNVKDSKKKVKRSALAWVGRTVGKRVVKKSSNVYVHNYNHHYHNSNSNSNLNRRNQSPQKNNFTTSSLNQNIRPNQIKKANKIDWSESAKQGTHFWFDVNIPQSNDSCYLAESDALEFHKLDKTVKCLAQKNESKKKCTICKIVVHESCLEMLQLHVKCRITFREAVNKKKSLKDKETISNISTSLQASINLHHWIYHKFKEEYFENKCQACLKSYTNRFGLQVSRTIVGCSWCKTAYHLKCFIDEEHKVECTFGDHSQLMVPPSWIVKSSNKNSVRSHNMIKPYDRRSSKRPHTQDQTIFTDNNVSLNTNETENSNNNNKSLLSPNLIVNTNNPLLQNSLKHSNHSFIVRPPTANSSSNNISLTKPLLVLINPKSGGKLGQKILRKFTWLLNPRQVFDLTLPGCPKFPLYLYRNVPNLRIIVGGGDGTVGWVLSVIDQIKFIGPPPAVAVLPLGTGNDLARTLNWGSGYTDESLNKILTKVSESRSIKLDRWKISTQPNLGVDLNSLEADENAIETLKNDEMNNYFSIGADAHVVLEFHERREANPHKFSTRWYNFLQYGQAGSRDQIKKTWKNLKDFIQLECDNKNYTDVIRSRGYHCIIFLNIPSYSSGTNPWGSSIDSNYQPQAINDGRVEVIGCFTSTLTKILIGGAGERICQAKYIKLTTSTYIPIQIDGEPAKLCPSIIEIKHKNQAIMLEHVKYNTDSPILGYHSNLQKNFEVKCILMEDFELYRKETSILENKAINVGTICTANTTDSLLKIRNTINLLISNCANGFHTSKWSFLNGEEFYRISDDSDECLLDIVSSDEIVYILDENPKYTNKSYNSNQNLKKNESIKAKLELKDYSNDNDDNLASNFQMQNLNKNEEKFALYANSAIHCNSSSNQIGIVSFQEKSKIISLSQSSDLEGS